MTPPAPSDGPLFGLRVLELGQLLAGPWAGTILGYLGADVIKVEPPAGDPIRSWRLTDEDGTSFWWRSIARNKRCVVIDLRRPDGCEIAKKLALGCDVLIENFRPGTMEKWGLGPEVFEVEHPRLIYARVSGYGQTGPYRERPGYASVAEAIGGLRHLTGHPDEPPVRANLSLGDTLAGLHTAIGVLAALYARDGASRDGASRDGASRDGASREGASGEGASGEGVRSEPGQVIDTALYEAVFSVLESVVPEHAGAGAVRGPSGSTISGVAPSNLYPCVGAKQVVIGANGESMFRRLLAAIGRPELGDDPRFRDNPRRVANAAELDAILSAWTSTRTVGQVVDALVDAAVPCGPIYDAADMRADPHFVARGLFERVEGALELPAIAPKLARTPGATRWAGRSLGADTDAVLRERLGLDPEALRSLRERGVIS